MRNRTSNILEAIEINLKEIEVPQIPDLEKEYRELIRNYLTHCKASKEKIVANLVAGNGSASEISL